MLAFVNQAAPDIRRKLQKIERLGEQSLQDLVRAAERVFNHRETPEEREDRIRREEREFRAEENHKNQKYLSQLFLVLMVFFSSKFSFFPSNVVLFLLWGLSMIENSLCCPH